MTYSIADRLKYCGTRMKALHSEVVTYARGVNQVLISATVGRANHIEYQGQSPACVDLVIQEWFVTAEDLILDGSTVTPERLDTITRANGEVYKVTRVRTEQEDLSTSNETWRHTNVAKDRMRIHTERTS